jgi:hypothetical protein
VKEISKSAGYFKNPLIKIPLAESVQFDLDQYVTAKALDGRYLMLAEEEKKIRQDPAARGTDSLKKIFGSQ